MPETPDTPTVHDLLTQATTALDAIGVASAAQDATIAGLTQQLAAALRPTPVPPVDRLLTATDLVYQGAFRLPRGDVGGPPLTGFSYGGTALAYNAARGSAHGSLLLVGHKIEQLVGEVGIPPTLTPTAAHVADLPVAPLLQRLSEALAGRKGDVFPAAGNPPCQIGGLLVDGDRLVASVFVYYDADNQQVGSHFVRPLDLTVAGPVTGPLTVCQTWTAGFVSGYMGRIPAAWQARLKGTVFVGQGCLSIISRTSYGPGVFALDLATLLTPTPDAIPLVCYPSTHPALGDYATTNPNFNGTTSLGGVVMPEGTASILFFGRHGMGPNVYGEGTANRALDGTPAGDGATLYYDPTSTQKGSHGFPYATRVWAYDARVCAEVAAGTRQPWEVLPYAIWTIMLPFDPGTGAVAGVAYDPATGRIFLSQPNADTDAPIIHVLEVAGMVTTQ